MMLEIKASLLLLLILILPSALNAETCIKASFNVTYTCNGGEEIGTLPAPKTATYASSFSTGSITTSMCASPDGYAMAGLVIMADGEVVAETTSSSTSFKYYFDKDIEIGPRWVSIASPNAIAVNLSVGGSSYTYDRETQEWSVVFPYGVVHGAAKCSTIKPENTAYGYNTGLIASDQDAIESAEDVGQYCYCKLIEPYVDSSLWVFNYDDGDEAGCATDCAYYCGRYVQATSTSSRRFRASIFQAAVDMAANQ